MELQFPYTTVFLNGFIYCGVLLLLIMTEMANCFNQSQLYETKPCTLLVSNHHYHYHRHHCHRPHFSSNYQQLHDEIIKKLNR